MTWTAAGSFLFNNDAALAVNNQATGNLLLVVVFNYTNSTVTCTGLTGGGATWVQVGTNVTFASGIAAVATVFAGTVTATGAGTATPTWSGTAPAGYEINGHEFHSSVGSWLFHTQGHIDNSGGSANWASLTPSVNGELYFGFAGDTTAAVAGSTSGYVYSVDANNDGTAYNLSCPSGVATFPVWGDNAQAWGVMILMQEGAASPYFGSHQAVRSRLPRGPYVLGNPGLIYQVSRDGTP